MANNLRTILSSVTVLVALLGSAHAAEFDFQLDGSSIPQFKQVTNDIYRGGRPGNSGLDQIAKMGVRTVIDLENDSQVIAQEKSYARSLNLNWISEPMSAGSYPDEREVNAILSALQDSRKFPIFVHCKLGEDRSGLIIGLYRVLVQGWKPADAYNEMLQMGFHPKYTQLVKYFNDKTAH